MFRERDMTSSMLDRGGSSSSSAATTVTAESSSLALFTFLELSFTVFGLALFTFNTLRSIRIVYGSINSSLSSTGSGSASGQFGVGSGGAGSNGSGRGAVFGEAVTDSGARDRSGSTASGTALPALSISTSSPAHGLLDHYDSSNNNNGGENGVIDGTGIDESEEGGNGRAPLLTQKTVIQIFNLLQCLIGFVACILDVIVIHIGGTAFCLPRAYAISTMFHICIIIVNGVVLSKAYYASGRSVAVLRMAVVALLIRFGVAPVLYATGIEAHIEQLDSSAPNSPTVCVASVSKVGMVPYVVTEFLIAVIIMLMFVFAMYEFSLRLAAAGYAMSAVPREAPQLPPVEAVVAGPGSQTVKEELDLLPDHMRSPNHKINISNSGSGNAEDVDDSTAGRRQHVPSIQQQQQQKQPSPFDAFGITNMLNNRNSYLMPNDMLFPTGSIIAPAPTDSGAHHNSTTPGITPVSNGPINNTMVLPKDQHLSSPLSQQPAVAEPSKERTAANSHDDGPAPSMSQRISSYPKTLMDQLRVIRHTLAVRPDVSRALFSEGVGFGFALFLANMVVIILFSADAVGGHTAILPVISAMTVSTMLVSQLQSVHERSVITSTIAANMANEIQMQLTGSGGSHGNGGHYSEDRIQELKSFVASSKPSHDVPIPSFAAERHSGESSRPMSIHEQFMSDDPAIYATVGGMGSSGGSIKASRRSRSKLDREFGRESISDLKSPKHRAASLRYDQRRSISSRGGGTSYTVTAMNVDGASPDVPPLPNSSAVADRLFARHGQSPPIAGGPHHPQPGTLHAKRKAANSAGADGSLQPPPPLTIDVAPSSSLASSGSQTTSNSVRQYEYKPMDVITTPVDSEIGSAQPVANVDSIVRAVLGSATHSRMNSRFGSVSDMNVVPIGLNVDNDCPLPTLQEVEDDGYDAVLETAANAVVSIDEQTVTPTNDGENK
ncbi:hypothetical protein GQ42DRAFT_153693 [Ramicandelaber brevisporus]|nr:hypothetical protein GQ42DRAFT_153693 [Ramicandelaber brevisporus]